MWYLAIIFVALVGIVLGITGMLKVKTSNTEFEKNLMVDHKLRVSNPNDSIPDHVSRADIVKKLKKLADSPVTVLKNMGAMCYDMAGPPERVDYICPVCAEKTIYSDGHTWQIEYELPRCRSLVINIKSLNIKLDESQFCRKCSPDATDPSLCIRINYENEVKPWICCNVSNEDLELIYEFMNGEKKHVTFNEAEYPLKDYTDRLEQLLGVSIKE